MRVFLQWVVTVTLLGAVSLAQAEYADECRELADRLAAEPGSLKASEIDLLKSCLAGLQRSQALGEKVAPTPKPALNCPPPPPEKVCPVCPPAPVCPKAPAAIKERDRDREDRLRPQLQAF